MPAVQTWSTYAGREIPGCNRAIFVCDAGAPAAPVGNCSLAVPSSWRPFFGQKSIGSSTKIVAELIRLAIDRGIESSHNTVRNETFRIIDGIQRIRSTANAEIYDALMHAKSLISHVMQFEDWYAGGFDSESNSHSEADSEVS
jgi:hypothetical protein